MNGGVRETRDRAKYIQLIWNSTWTWMLVCLFKASLHIANEPISSDGLNEHKQPQSTIEVVCLSYRWKFFKPVPRQNWSPFSSLLCCSCFYGLVTHSGLSYWTTSVSANVLFCCNSVKHHNVWCLLLQYQDLHSCKISCCSAAQSFHFETVQCCKI